MATRSRKPRVLLQLAQGVIIVLFAGVAPVLPLGLMMAPSGVLSGVSVIEIVRLLLPVAKWVIRYLTG
ncbi:MAG TPA: hypothetical protein VK886_09725 [Vicinamibacterales bacterium]|nr:hypothetical protein [Vicinamibacterales bacterium]